MRKLVAGIALSAGLLGGCMQNPVAGQSEFSLVSAQQEVAIGEQNYQPSVQAQGGRYVQIAASAGGEIGQAAQAELQKLGVAQTQ